MKSIRGKLLALAGLAVLSSQSAFAASNTCWMIMEPFKCTTSNISANARDHFVHIDLSSRVKYKVVDADNGAVVSSGTSGWTGTKKTITGLYGRYHIKAEAVGLFRAYATINNN